MPNLSFVISIIAGLLWVVVFRFLRKPLGIKREGALRKLSFNQYVCLLGALSWGFAMFISSVVDNYLQGMLSGKPAPHTSAVWMVFELVWWLAGGCLFGWLMSGGDRMA
jgi:H+/Cl- antiporter ClcA